MINMKHVGSEKDPLHEQYLISVDQIIGKGSFGKVYIAYNYQDYQRNQINNQICAKEIPRALLSDKLVKSIRNEASIQMHNCSPRVLRMHCMKQTKSNVYFFLEYCPDGDLKHLIYNNNLNEMQILFLFGQIAQALSDLKKEGVFHRDLKPENILLKDGSIKIADFGFSKVVMENTKNNTQVGTPLYMSPQALSSGCYDLEKNDVWSAGCLLYEMVFKQIPWKLSQQDQTVQALYSEITKNSVTFPKEVRVSAELKELINLMLEIDEDGRLDWDDILNKDIIKKSQQESIRAEIKQICEQRNKFTIQMTEEINISQGQKSNLSNQDKQPKDQRAQEDPNQRLNSDIQQQGMQKRQIIEQQMNPVQDEEGQEDLEEYLEEYSDEVEDNKVELNESQSMCIQIWRFIELHRSVYNQIQKKLKESMLKIIFLICLKLEEYQLCKLYILNSQNRCRDIVNQNVLEQVQIYLKDITSGIQEKQLKIYNNQLISDYKNYFVINNANSFQTMKNTFIEFKKQEIEIFLKRSDILQMKDDLVLFSKLKYISLHEYISSNGKYTNLFNFDQNIPKELIFYLQKDDGHIYKK